MNRLNDELLSKILVDQSYLEEEVVTVMLQRAKAKSVALTNVLIGEELITKDLIGQAVAEYYKVPYADLNSIIPDESLVRLVPEDVAKEYHLVVFTDENGLLTFATDDPKHPKLLTVLEKLVTENKRFENTEKIQVAYSLPEDIEALFGHYEVPLQEKLQKLLAENEVPVKQLIDEILSSAFESRATDIHFEPTSFAVMVRFRIDGVLHEMADLTQELYEKVVNRVKVLAKLRIDEHLSIQDGSFGQEWNKRRYDLRVSFVPTLYGEKLAMRVLAQYVGGLGLDTVGLSEAHQKMLLAAADKPFGMIVVSGPTGSGKTTTLYSVLSRVITPGVNVMTIEDPVEYRIKGATQVQVNNETGITFTSGLRSLVRQDPDVILVGEIRDKDSAEIAVNAALTGHLLLSTFHANNAATVMPRLVDMGVESFLLSSTIELIISQRLVRKLCDSCKVSETVSYAELEKEYPQAAKFLGKKGSKTTVYRAKGCKICNFRGYKGRTGIFEMISVTKELRELFLKHPSSDEIEAMAIKQGMTTLFEDGVDKVKNGVTTMSEILRVAQVSR
jgi:type II secretory ATPase GspE/PulE/Tfp pilus assembly ATPase PilB-like protein